MWSQCCEREQKQKQQQNHVEFFTKKNSYPHINIQVVVTVISSIAISDSRSGTLTMKKKTNNTENRIIQPECTGNQRQKKLLATFPYPCRSWMTDAAVDASRPVVGSSRNKTDGDIINSIPILVRFRSPPEIPRMNSFPTCQSKSEINKGHGMLFFFLVSFVRECV